MDSRKRGTGISDLSVPVKELETGRNCFKWKDGPYNFKKIKAGNQLPVSHLRLLHSRRWRNLYPIQHIKGEDKTFQGKHQEHHKEERKNNVVLGKTGSR